MILALDLGTTTGWAVRKDGNITSGSSHFGLGRFQGGGMRYLKFRSFLTDRQAESGFTVVYFEEVRAHKGVHAAHVYGGFLAILCAWCEEHAIPYMGVPVGSIKKFITGKGNASKQQVIEAVERRGFTPLDDNEADALALLLWAAGEMKSSPKEC